ncbi:MAG: antibiotic resistance protein MarC [Bacteroidetes bacterium GWA2_31_9]|nr:MAG: antibiotic resistance protein MarC [Bacteroidetes bacterium GWA2_31_9]
MNYFEFALLAFTSFFTLINPLGVMPIFLSMTSQMNTVSRNKVAIKAIVTSFLILLVFAFSGQILFKFFSITVDSFRIVGGIIFFKMGYDMLQAKIVHQQYSKEQEAEVVNDIAITPLAIPMICGPGAITNSIVLMEDAENLISKSILIGIILLVCLITLGLLLGAGRFVKLLGDTGNKVMMKLMGLIVMVIAVEFFLSGLIPIIKNLINS